MVQASTRAKMLQDLRRKDYRSYAPVAFTLFLRCYPRRSLTPHPKAPYIRMRNSVFHAVIVDQPYLIRYYFDDQRAKLGYLLAVFGDAFARRTPALGSVVRL